MANASDLMKRALKDVFLPELARRGFVGSRNEYQRRGETLDLLSIQHWKYGGAFTVELAQCPRGAMTMSWGDVVPEEKLTTAHISPTMRARLHSDQEAFPAAWFHFASFGDDPAKYRELSQRLVELLPSVEAWYAARTEAPHLRAFVSGTNHAD